MDVVGRIRMSFFFFFVVFLNGVTEWNLNGDDVCMYVYHAGVMFIKAAITRIENLGFYFISFNHDC